MSDRPARLKVASFYSYMCSGGDENRLLQYLPARDDARFEHIVIHGITPDAESEALNGPMQQRVRDAGVRLINLGIPSDHAQRLARPGAGLAASQALNFGRMIRRLARVLQDEEVDLIDGRNTMGSLVGTLGARLAGTRAIVSTNYELTRFYPRGWYELGQATYRMVDALVCDSQACLDDMRRWMKWAPPGYLVPNGIVAPAPSQPAAALRKQLGIPDDAVVVGQVARVQRIKGQDLLLEAAARLLPAHPRLFVLIVGYPQQARDYQEALQALVVQRGLKGRVAFAAWPGPVGDLWQLIDVHAHPTRQDSSPIALMEGMSLGKPVVTTRVGGIHEIITDEQTGLLIPPDDVDALTAALARLLGDRDWAAGLGAAARDRHQSRYAPAVMARGQEQVYDEVWARPARRSAR